MDLGLEGKVALVMGASKGIGRASPLLLRGKGRGSRSPAGRRSGSKPPRRRSGSSRRRSSPTPPTSSALPAAAGGRRGFRPVDILVTNTGGPPPGGALDHGFEEWEAAYRSLVLAPRILAGAAVPGMRDAGWGRIVNVGSTTTIEINPALGLSNAHRMATVGFLKTLAREVAGDGITVNTVATGRFATDRMAELGGSMENVEAAARSEVPAGRLGTVEEYGDLVAFLCSQRAAYITGTVIPIDGGLLRSTV